MKKTSEMVIMGVLALAIGLMIAVLINTTQGMDQGGLVPVAQVKAQEAELQKLRTESAQLTQELIAMEDNLDSMQKAKAQEDDSLKLILDEQEKYKLAAGMVEVKGPGIIITLEDPVSSDELSEGYSELMYRYELLLSLVNKLKDAGAEAISINGQRLISTTEISLAGENVNINATPTAPPYIIKAIGKPETLESTITIRFGVIEQIKSYGIRVDIAKQEELVVPRYSGIVKFRYAKPVKKEE